MIHTGEESEGQSPLRRTADDWGYPDPAADPAAECNELSKIMRLRKNFKKKKGQKKGEKENLTRATCTTQQRGWERAANLRVDYVISDV